MPRKHSDSVTVRADPVWTPAFLAALAPPARRSIADWAAEERELTIETSAEPGPWRNERTPYLVEIMECLSPDHPARFIVLMKGTQLGGSEVFNNWIGHTISDDPGPMLYVLPTNDVAKRYSRQRISSMVAGSAALRSKIRPSRDRDSGNTVLTKEYPGGILILTGSNSAVGITSYPISKLALDEVDRYVLDVDGQGDPIELAIRRTQTYEHKRKIGIVSSPTIKGLSAVGRWYRRTDQRVYFVPCPHCGLYQPIRWRAIRWEKDGEGPELSSIRLVCEGCEKGISERHKTEMLAAGEWRATSEGLPNHVGFHLSGLYSPLGWYSWEQAVIDHYKALRRGHEERKTWTNTVLGEEFEEEARSVEPMGLMGRRRRYPAEVPEAVKVLTAGVDIQDDRLELEIVGWGAYEESWGIDYRILWGDPAASSVWNLLLEALTHQYEHEAGKLMRPRATAIDSGYQTENVYNFVRKHGRRLGIFAVKGWEKQDVPLLSRFMEKQHGKNRRPVKLWLIGTHQAKSTLYSRLEIAEPGPGYCHFPLREEYGEEFFAQLASETLVTTYWKGRPRREWKKNRPRNEALDCRVYALAALHILRPKLEDPAPREIEPEEDPLPLSPTEVTERLVQDFRGPRRRKPGRWVDW